MCIYVCVWCVCEHEQNADADRPSSRPRRWQNLCRRCRSRSKAYPRMYRRPRPPLHGSLGSRNGGRRLPLRGRSRSRNGGRRPPLRGSSRSRNGGRRRSRRRSSVLGRRPTIRYVDATPRRDPNKRHRQAAKRESLFPESSQFKVCITLHCLHTSITHIEVVVLWLSRERLNRRKEDISRLLFFRASGDLKPGRNQALERCKNRGEGTMV